MSIASPAGTPSMIVTSALPCDSPAVKNRSMRAHSIRNICVLWTAIRRSAARNEQAVILHRRVSIMELIADRFALHEGTCAFDLATGARVRLIVGSAGGVSEQLRWTDTCT